MATMTWQEVVFIILSKLIAGGNRIISLTEITTDDNIRLAEQLTGRLGKKQNPQHPEATIRNTLNKMRKKGLIDFLDYRGQYKLTDAGYEIAKDWASKSAYDKVIEVINI